MGVDEAGVQAEQHVGDGEGLGVEPVLLVPLQHPVVAGRREHLRPPQVLEVLDPALGEEVRPARVAPVQQHHALVGENPLEGRGQGLDHVHRLFVRLEEERDVQDAERLVDVARQPEDGGLRAAPPQAAGQRRLVAERPALHAELHPAVGLVAPLDRHLLQGPVPDGVGGQDRPELDAGRALGQEHRRRRQQRRQDHGDDQVSRFHRTVLLSPGQRRVRPRRPPSHSCGSPRRSTARTFIRKTGRRRGRAAAAPASGSRR